MEGLQLANDFDGSQDTIDVLVGSDFYWDIVIGDNVSGDGPTAISSKLGRLLSGPIKGAKTDNHIVSNLIISGELPMRETDEVTAIMQRFWETESIGIEDISKCQQAFKLDYQFSDISFNGKFYEAGLPWKQLSPSSDNRQMCETRLKFLYRKLKVEPALLSKYRNIIQEQERNGIIEMADEALGDDSNNKRHPLLASSCRSSKGS